MERKFGSLESPKDLRDFRVCSAAKAVTLPEEYGLKPASIKDQGYVNSCVAHALSSMIEEKEGTTYSTGWIYGYRPEGYYQGEGMYPREALKTLQKLGAVQNKNFNYNIEMQEAKKKVDDNFVLLEALADEYKIQSYARLYTEQEIKSWLYNKQTPVPIAIATESLQLDDKNIVQVPEYYPNSGHMMLLLGWNETGYIVQNSWGKDWGDNGLCILPYEYKIREAWGVTLAAQEPTDIEATTPTFYILRKLIQFIIDFIKEVINNGNK